MNSSGSLAVPLGTLPSSARQPNNDSAPPLRPESPSGSGSGSGSGEDDDDDDADGAKGPLRPIEQQNRSWAARNSNRPTIPVKQKKKRSPMTEAQKATLEIARKQKQINDRKLEDEVSIQMSEHAEKLKKIAENNNVKIEVVKGIANHQHVFRVRRAPNIYNAILHAKSMEINEGTCSAYQVFPLACADCYVLQGLPPGEKKRLSELQDLCKSGRPPSLLPQAQKDELIELLVAHRAKQQAGTRCTNAAAAKDQTHTNDAITVEVSVYDLHSIDITNLFLQMDNAGYRNGSYMIYLATPGHVNDTYLCTYYGSDNAMEFLIDVLGLDPDEVCRKFQLWACSKEQSKSYFVTTKSFLIYFDVDQRERDTLLNVRAACVRYVQQGLSK